MILEFNSVANIQNIKYFAIKSTFILKNNKENFLKNVLENVSQLKLKVLTFLNFLYFCF